MRVRIFVNLTNTDSLLNKQGKLENCIFSPFLLSTDGVSNIAGTELAIQICINWMIWFLHELSLTGNPCAVFLTVH